MSFAAEGGIDSPICKCTFAFMGFVLQILQLAGQFFGLAGVQVILKEDNVRGIAEVADLFLQVQLVSLQKERI